MDMNQTISSYDFKNDYTLTVMEVEKVSTATSTSSSTEVNSGMISSSMVENVLFGVK